MIEFPHFKVTVDLIIVLKRNINLLDSQFVFLTRNTEPFLNKYAMVGGYYNAEDILDKQGNKIESQDVTGEEAAVREAKEEILLDIDPKEIKFYKHFDSVGRDPRGRTLTLVYYYIFDDPKDFFDQIKEYKPTREAKNIVVFSRSNLKNLLENNPESFAFDHNKIMQSFLHNLWPTALHLD